MSLWSVEVPQRIVIRCARRWGWGAVVACCRLPGGILFKGWERDDAEG